MKVHGPFKRNALYSEMLNADKDQKFCKEKRIPWQQALKSELRFTKRFRFRTDIIVCLEDGDSHEVIFSGFSIPSSIPNHTESKDLKFVLSLKSTITIRNHAISKSLHL